MRRPAVVSAPAMFGRLPDQRDYVRWRVGAEEGRIWQDWLNRQTWVAAGGISCCWEARRPMKSVTAGCTCRRVANMICPRGTPSAAVELCDVAGIFADGWDD